jgi:hypothetical protein
MVCLLIYRKFYQALFLLRNYHIKHHSFQGVHELDADLPNRWEAKLISNSFLGKALMAAVLPGFSIIPFITFKRNSSV